MIKDYSHAVRNTNKQIFKSWFANGYANDCIFRGMSKCFLFFTHLGKHSKYGSEMLKKHLISRI